ncbi:MAG: FAD-binding oxidoreductase [Acidimicrobiales bacterium]
MEVEALVGLVDPGGVVTDADRLAGVVTDWTGRWSGWTPAMVSPTTAAQTAAVVSWCRDNGVAVVPQGGNTGLVGGSVPLDGEIVVSTRRMTDIAVDADSGTIVAGAGATLAAVQAAAHAAGWEYPVDLGARDSATIGGTVATNAGGLHVIRHGDTRHQLLGIEAITGNGEIVGDLRGLVKDNTGYHLPSLFAGSEGTLGIITRICARLVAPVADTAVALVGVESVDDLVETIGDLRRRLTDLSAVEVMFEPGLTLVCDHLGLGRPFARRCSAYVLVECAGAVGAVDRLAAVLGDHVLVDDAVAVADDTAGRASLWRYREAHTEAINAVGVPHKLDVTIPQRHLARFVTAVDPAVHAVAPGAAVWLFGHGADGNIHVNVTGVAPDDQAVDGAVLSLVASLDGSISAEHGIGRAKTPWLHLNRNPAELALFARIRTTFDPVGILNPAVLVR